MDYINITDIFGEDTSSIKGMYPQLVYDTSLAVPDVVDLLIKLAFYTEFKNTSNLFRRNVFSLSNNGNSHRNTIASYVTTTYGIAIGVVKRDILNTFTILKQDSIGEHPVELLQSAYDKPLSDYLMQSVHHKIMAYVSPITDARFPSVVIATNQNLEPETMNKLYAVLPALFGFDFAESEYKLNPDIFKLLVKPTLQPFIEAAKEWYNTAPGLKEFVKQARARSLAASLAQFYNRRKSGLDRKLNDVQNAIADKEMELTDRYRILRELQAQIFYYTEKNVAEDQEVIALLARNKTIQNITPYDRGIVVTVSCPVKNYNKEDMDLYFTRINTISDYDKAAFKKIFVDEEYILTCSASIYIAQDCISYRSGFNCDAHGYPNPHLNHHNCFGQNKPALIKAVDAGDFTTIVPLLSATVGNINALDAPVMNGLISDLCGSTAYRRRSYLTRVSDGTVLSLNDLVAQIRAEEARKAQEQEQAQVVLDPEVQDIIDTEEWEDED